MDDNINVLVDTDSHFSKYFMASKDMLILMDSEDMILKVNDKLTNATGHTQEDLEGKSITKIIHPDDIQSVVQEFLDIKSEVKPNIDLENRLICTDGSIKYVSWRGTMNEDGYFYIRILDLTDSVLREQHLRELNDDLEQLLYIASHDLREPLVGSAGFVSLVMSKYSSSLNDEAKEFLTDALGGISLMEKKIDDLLLLSRVGRNFTDDSFYINDSFDEAIKVLNGRLKDVKITSSLDEITSYVKGNQIMISQVFQNLISNAFKYRNREVDPCIDISHSIQNNVLTVSIHDNGIGFDQEHSDRIFLPFQRLHSDESEYPGTGIGLALCKKIISKHNGNIWVESKLGEGSTFYFTLTMRKDSED